MEGDRALPEEVYRANAINRSNNESIEVSRGHSSILRYEGLNNNNFEVNKEVDVLTRTAANTVVKTER
ncbi:hypothetical protein TK11N_24970 [Tetragenococcus koreensis]|uniref:Uncharacterized protein n=1 Tax=Tetragenococcus koreensis TaxID=290335 RepID=A0AAN4RKA2_9ENTE|nr:hypothetical protein TKO01_24170 [Tetragenococcus koreensis]GEQ50645.1 hypothetical protein TK11N_24970 [Tetragenococcus koreensis]GEQ53148.1 hypothetical protein TK12N_24920 [Tetragenococcus koreensis]GEQ53992.1 hypothetical protein TK2N_08360 [Tetragenococcus koreensis]GEQ58152.1 hypothetical protein TK4N_24950 [Tetragenococcus koreensis]